MDLFEELRLLAEGLQSEGVDYALCGALALAVHGVPRATRDIDIIARRDDLERVRRVASARGFTVEALPMTFSGTGVVMHRFTKLEQPEPLMLDVLIAQPPIDQVFAERIEVELEEGTLWVVSRRGLVTLKLAAARPQDLVDVQRLEELGDAEDDG